MPAVKKTQNKKSSTGTKKQKEVVVEEVVVEEVVPKVKQRVVVDKESISTDFDSVISDITNEIQTMRSSSDGKTKGRHAGRRPDRRARSGQRGRSQSAHRTDLRDPFWLVLHVLRP